MDEKTIELFARAIQTLGEATDEELVEYLSENHGVRIEPKYVPIYRASLVDRRKQAQIRRESPEE